MAPKHKASDAGNSTGGKSSHSNNSNYRHGNSERGIGNTNGNSAASERASGGTGGGNERSNSGAGHAEKSSSSNAASAGAKRKAESPIITIDFADMDINALRRYCRLNKLKPKSKSQEDMSAIATKHWNNVNVKEVDSVAYFLFAVKHRHNVLKLTMPLP
ncbi:hypothetical protein BGZ76_002954 [Entomortierella beljakovae]|nr:hypothetical protein BGZ76_002954 [Entomortierella beljakovae]